MEPTRMCLTSQVDGNVMEANMSQRVVIVFYHKQNYIHRGYSIRHNFIVLNYQDEQL